MQTVSAIIEALGGFRAVAEAARVPQGTASSWKTRGSIPGSYWRDLIADAKRRGIEGVTYEALAQAHARPAGDEAPLGLAS